MFLQLSPRINCKYAKSVNELIQFISSFFEATSEIADERRLADKFNHLAYQVDEFFKKPTRVRNSRRLQRERLLIWLEI